MIKKFFTKVKATLGEKTKSMFLYGGANKKAIASALIAIAIILIAVLGLGVLAAHWKIQRYANLNMARNGYAMKHYPNSVQPGSGDEFVLPQDAAKSGEIAIIVDDLDSAKNSVQSVAAQNEGVIYNTFIAYASDNIKNGSIVVQVPSANFEAAFSGLKKIGSQVVQESSKQIPVINPIVYPQIQPMAEVSDIPAGNDQNVNDSEIAPAPAVMPAYPQITQDKGYIKVIFADYGKSSGAISEIAAKKNVGNILGVGYNGLNMRENMWVVLAIKSIVLIVLIWVIVLIAKRIIVNLQKINRNRKTVVRQIVKNRKRVIKIAARKKKK